jgi:undecaprenyl-diphosphatase
MLGPAIGLDHLIIERAAELRAHAPEFTRFAAAFTMIGGAMVTLSLSAIAALALLLRGKPGAALLLAGTVLIERFMVDGLKDWVGRPRPALEPFLQLPQSLAYPSGHAANSMTAFLAVALIASPARYRWAATVAALILTVLVGCSRIVLGIHWPSDVIGGWAFGLLCVGIALQVGERSAILLPEPQHDVVRRHRLSADEQESA